LTLGIATIGDSVVDIIISVPHFPTENEETVHSEGMHHQLGGSSNFLIMSSRLGLKTGVIDRLGDDELAVFYRENLAGERVDVSQLKTTSDTQTAHCICLVDQQGNHSYISFPGATYGLSKDQIDPDYIAEFKALYLSGYSLTREPIREATLKALDVAFDNQLKIYFDPSPLISHIPAEKLQHVIKHTNGLFLNEREQKILTTMLPEVDINEHCDFVALKQGERGCTIYSLGEHHHYMGQKVEPIDTTGAGDVFNAAFIYGDLKGWKLSECVRFANALAAEKVKKLGAGLNVPTRIQAEILLAEIRSV
jgi:sugar/nucleoside kinase (ribokinase family)